MLCFTRFYHGGTEAFISQGAPPLRDPGETEHTEEGLFVYLRHGEDRVTAEE